MNTQLDLKMSMHILGYILHTEVEVVNWPNFENRELRLRIRETQSAV